MGQKVEGRAGTKRRSRGSRDKDVAGRGFREGETHGAARASLYDSVTSRIISELEAGRLPWVQTWERSGGASASLPHNACSGRAYSGINILILWGAVIEAGYPSQGWLTFRQALEAGGNVRKGERGTTVVHADKFVPKGEAERVARDGGDVRAVPFLKSFTVFNVAQCGGLREGIGIDPAPLPEREIVPVAEAVIAASGVEFRIGGDRAFYVPAHDYVQVPPQPAFFDQINYYRTALHELTHATGHVSRLDRKLLNGFGSKDYAREELVAGILPLRTRDNGHIIPARPTEADEGGDAGMAMDGTESRDHAQRLPLQRVDQRMREDQGLEGRVGPVEADGRE